MQPRVELGDNHGTLQVARVILNSAHPADFSALATADILDAREEHLSLIDAHEERSRRKRTWLAVAMLAWGLGCIFLLSQLLPPSFVALEVVLYLGGLVALAIADTVHTRERDAWQRVALIRLGAMDQVLIRRRDWVMPADFQSCL